MKIQQGRKAGWVVIVAALLIVALLVGACVYAPQPADEETTFGVEAAGGVDVLRSLRVTNRIDNRGTLTQEGAATFGGTLAVTGGSNFAGGASFSDATVTDDLVVGSSVSVAKQNNITVTNNMTVTLTGSFAGLTAAGAVGTSAVSGCEANGHLSLFANMGSNTITITDTGNLKLAGNWAAGQFDTLLTVGDGSNCIEIARANN